MYQSKREYSSYSPVAIALVLALAALRVPAEIPYHGANSLLVVYLEVSAGPAKETELVLGNIQLIGEKDTMNLGVRTKTWVGGKGAGRQLILCEQAVPAGRYTSLRLHFDRITAHAQAARIRPLPPDKGLVIPLDLSTVPEGPTPIFLQWDPDLDALVAKTYVPSIKVQPESRVSPASLAIISNTGSDYLTCIDRFRHRVVGVLPTGRKPMDMVYSSLRREFYVANSASDDISVLDLHTGRLERTLSLRGGDEPGRIALSTDQRRLYVLNRGSHSISVLNLLSHQEEGRVHLETAPSSLLVDGWNDAIYVTSRDSDQLHAIDAGTLSVTPLLRLDANLGELAFNPKERRLYVVKIGQRQLSVLDLARNAVVGNIRLCAPAAGFAFHPVARTLFASMADCGLVSILKPDDNLELGSINLPHAPDRISLDPEAKSLIVTFPTEGKIAFYNANSWKQQALIDVGKQPFAVAFAP